MADRVEINISRIKIAGVGGFGMLAMVGVMAYAMPEARRFVLLSYSAGILGAFVFIAYRRWIKPERPHGPTLMTVNTPNGQVSGRMTTSSRNEVSFLNIRPRADLKVGTTTVAVRLSCSVF
jgi:hypothetical protein